VQINPAGLDINSDLTFQQNNATDVRSIIFYENNTVLSGVNDIGSIYAVGINLWYNNGNGVPVQITNGTSIAGTTGSITGLTSPASASYVSANSTFIFQSGVALAGNIDVGSVILRNTSPNSTYGITLSAPASLSANYTLTLPTPAAITGAGSGTFLQVNSSGVVSAVTAVNAITTANIAANSITNPLLGPGLQMETDTLTITSGAVAMNVALANSFYVSCSASAALTVNMSNWIDGQAAIISINANGHTVPVTFTPATGSVLWQGGVQLAQSTGLDIYTILYNAVTGNYYAVAAQNYA
jgi:hypothetical protein